MSLRFAYHPFAVTAPVLPLGGRLERPKPLVRVTLVGPRAAFVRDGLLDTGADDTVFPDLAAASVGIDLSNAPVGQGMAVGGGVLAVRYALAKLRVTDGQEYREWTAMVGFTAARSEDHCWVSPGACSTSGPTSAGTAGRSS